MSNTTEPTWAPSQGTKLILTVRAADETPTPDDIRHGLYRGAGNAAELPAADLPDAVWEVYEICKCDYVQPLTLEAMKSSFPFKGGRLVYSGDRATAATLCYRFRPTCEIIDNVALTTSDEEVDVGDAANIVATDWRPRITGRDALTAIALGAASVSGGENSTAVVGDAANVTFDSSTRVITGDRSRARLGYLSSVVMGDDATLTADDGATFLSRRRTNFVGPNMIGLGRAAQASRVITGARARAQIGHDSAAIIEDDSVLVAGDEGSVVAGQGARVTTGDAAKVIGGDRSTLNGGDGATVIGGDGSRVQVGAAGIAIGGHGSEVSAGLAGTLIIRSKHGAAVVGVVDGEKILPNRLYRLKKGKLVPAARG